jgi:DUF1680 family protein
MIVFAVANLFPMQPIVNLQPVPWKDVVVDDVFWKPRIETNRNVTLEHGFQMLEKHGYETNFIRAAQRKTGGFQGLVFQDSDVYKLLEAAALSLAVHPDSAIQKHFDHWVDLIEMAQLEDGYLNTYFQLNGIEMRWKNLRDQHELYCAGHLIEAAVADYLGSGRTNLLKIAERFAGHIENRFGRSKQPGYPGHPELELALIKLSSATGERKYFDLAKHFVKERGTHYFAREHNTPEDQYDGAYWQDRVPIAALDVIEGHAVRAAYLLSAVTDIVMQSQDPPLEAMQLRVWNNATQKRMYITGGAGNSSANEGFTKDYELPNESAYQETCASIAMVLWNYRLGLAYADSKYADMMERALYNGVLSGVALDGKRFFYENPLASSGGHHRREWYACACCPPNVARLLASLGGYAYAKTDEALYVNLYIAGKITTNLGAEKISAEIQTQYPWDGTVTIKCNVRKEKLLKLRIPEWAPSVQLRVDGKVVSPKVEHGYATVPASELIEIQFPMDVRTMQSHPLVEANRGRAAFSRGPLVYCFEQQDQLEDIERIFIPSETRFAIEKQVSLDVVTLVADGYAIVRNRWPGGLYASVAEPKKIKVQAIPYAFWDNRNPGKMAVWMPTSAPPTRDTGPEADARVSVSFESEIAKIAGVNDGEEPQSSGDQPGKLCHFWPHKGGTEWIQYTFDEPIRISGMSVYFFDDTGRGECRVPAKWHAEAWAEEKWRRIDANYGAELDKWNSVSFEPIRSTAFRLVLQMADGWSAGVHEWKLIVGN